MNRLILAVGLLVGATSAARAEDCTSVSATQKVEYVKNLPPLTAVSPATYGSTSCPRFVIDFHDVLSSGVEYWSSGLAPSDIQDQAACESAELRFTVWGFQPSTVNIHGGRWVGPLADDTARGQWLPGDGHSPPSCQIPDAKFVDTRGYNLVRIAVGVYENGQPLEIGPIYTMAY
jgi:hypothetical protein